MKEFISVKEGATVMTLFLVGSSLVLGVGAEAEQDVWLAILLAMAMAIPVLLIYARLIALFPEKNLFDIVSIVFGKVIGIIPTLLYIWYSFHLGSLVMRNFSEFIRVVAFPDTPQFVMIAFTGLVCIWALKDGIELLGRVAAFSLPIVIGTIIIVSVLTMTKAHYEIIRPVLYNGLKPVLGSSFSMFSFPFAETVVFTMVFHTLKSSKGVYKVYLISLLISGSLIIALALRNVLVLGADIVSNLYFPSYQAVSVIDIGDFLERIEVTVAVVFLFAGFLKTSVCLYAATLGVSKVLKIDNYRFIIAPMGLLMMALAQIIYQSTMEMNDWATNTYKYYAIPFQILLPLVIWIAAEVKSRRKKAKCAA